MARSDDTKDSRELEQEVEQQRSAVERTLIELIERFSPQRMLQSLLNQGDEGQRDQPIPRQLMDTLSANPIPTLLAAAGVGWLMMSQARHSEHDPELAPASDEPSHASYGVDPDYDPRSGVGHVALEKDHHEGGETVPYQSTTYSDNVGNQVNSLLRNQPLLVAAFGIAVGGLLGAALPRLSRHEVGFSERLQEFGERARPTVGEDLLGEGESAADSPTRH